MAGREIAQTNSKSAWASAGLALLQKARDQ